MQELQDSLARFSPISLTTIGFENLLRRYDTKFIIPKDETLSILQTLVPYYQVLEIDNRRIFGYENLYFDTDDYFFYLQHHNRNFSRYKIRYRRYLSSEACFFEVKCKSNKGRTVKERIEVDSMDFELSEETKSFAKKKISDKTNINVDMVMPKLWTYYHRITLVNQFIKERLTIDLDLSFRSEDSRDIKTKGLVIAEAKQERINLDSPFMRCVRDNGIRRTGFSKYCAGIALLNNNVKSNRFKRRLLRLNNYLVGV